MRLGISAATRGGLGARDVAELAAGAEAAGLDAFFVAERVADAVTLAGAAVAATSRITIGTAVVNARLRHPALLAMASAALGEQSDGRFTLGIGTSNPGLAEGVFGLGPVRPLAFVREYVDVLRAAAHAGVDAGGPDGGVVRAFTPDRPPAQRVPLLVAGLQPGMLRLAGELADGVLLGLTTPASLPAAISAVAEGAARSGRTLADLDVACVLPSCVGEPDDVSLRAGRDIVAGYALHPAASKLFAASGHTDALAEAARLLLAGDRAAALDAITPAMVDDFVLRGDEHTVAERLRACAAAGVGLPILFPTPADGDWQTAVRRTTELAARVRPHLDSHHEQHPSGTAPDTRRVSA